MKKFLFFVFALFLFVGVANAQWHEPQSAMGDELTETPNSWIDLYYDSDGDIVFYQSLDFTKGSNSISFYPNKGIFAYDDNNYAKCVIVFYNNDKLIEKITTKVWVSIATGDAYLFGPRDGTEHPIIKKIINHLSNVGNVQFIIPTCNTGDFDITVTKNPNLFKK